MAFRKRASEIRWVGRGKWYNGESSNHAYHPRRSESPAIR